MNWVVGLGELGVVLGGLGVVLGQLGVGLGEPGVVIAVVPASMEGRGRWLWVVELVI